jgi:hypothetical protein
MLFHNLQPKPRLQSLYRRDDLNFRAFRCSELLALLLSGDSLFENPCVVSILRFDLLK